MRKILLSTLMLGTSMVAQQASAAVFVCEAVGNTPCVTAMDAVHITKDSSPVEGTTDSGVKVFFTSTTDVLSGAAAGLATVESVDGFLSQLTFMLETGYTFETAEFNIEPLQGNKNPFEAAALLIEYYDPTLQSYGVKSINVSGQNKLGIYGDAGEKFIGVSFTASPSTEYGFTDLKQLKFGGIAPIGAIPEPSTWAMLLLGLGVVGASMRRRKVNVSFA